MQDHYTIDLRSKYLDIRTYSADLIVKDLELLGLKKPMDMDLSDTFNTKIFRSESAAFLWRFKYLERYAKLLRNGVSKKGVKKMLCKRRYIILAALGEKMYTRRDYLKAWKKGDEFQLYDQTFFLSVRLKKITDDLDGKFTYHYAKY